MISKIIGILLVIFWIKNGQTIRFLWRSNRFTGHILLDPGSYPEKIFDSFTYIDRYIYTRIVKGYQFKMMQSLDYSVSSLEEFKLFAAQAYNWSYKL